MAEFSIHNVSRVQVEVDTAPVQGAGAAYWQTLYLFDAAGAEIGRVVLFLDAPEAALQVGGEPPYWGVDTGRAPAQLDGEPPF